VYLVWTTLEPRVTR